MALYGMVLDETGDVPAVAAIGGTGRRVLSGSGPPATTGSEPDAVQTGNRSRFCILTWCTGWGGVHASTRDPGGLIRGILTAVLLIGLLAIPAMAVPVLVLSPSAGPGGIWVDATGSSFDLDALEFARATLLFDGAPVVNYIPFTGSGFSTSFEVPSGTTPGIHTVHAVGPRDSAEAVFTVTNLAPRALIDADSWSGRAPLSVHFSGMRSYDEDGSISSYLWDFGDGTSMTGEAVDHTFASPGAYRTTLTVTDDQGRSGNTSVAISVERAPSVVNRPPVAGITVLPQRGSVPLTVRLDGSQSYDPDDVDLSYSWDFGDGMSGAGVTAWHTFEREGTYQLSLLVTDPHRASDRAEAAVEVNPPFPWWLVIGGLGVVAGGLFVRGFLRSSRTTASPKRLPPNSRVPGPPVRIGIQSGVACPTRRESGLTGITVDVRSGIMKEEEMR